MNEQACRIDRLLSEATRSLAGSETARLDAELLLAHSIHQSRSWLYAHADESPQQDNVQQFHNLLAKRQAGEPIAYLIGHCEFWSMTLKVNEHTLIPRPETECVVEYALAHIPTDAKPHIADLGTGSGAIALAIGRERINSTIVATDISDAALAIARHNRDRQALANISFIHSNWFQNLTDESFDVIISNPPYVASNDAHLLSGDVRFEPIQALQAGIDGMDCLHSIIVTARDYLSNGGQLVLEHGYDQGQQVQQLLSENGYHGINTIHDLSGHHRGSAAIWQH